MKHSTAGITIGVPSNNRQNYWDSVARKLGVPLDDDGSYGYEWSALLAKAIADAKTEPLDLWQRFQNGVLCNPTFEPDDPPDLPAQVQRAGIHASRVLIFDNFDRVSEKEVEFIRSFYETCFGSGVLVFILTQDANTANLILRLNGWARVRPLEGIYTATHNEGDPLPVCGYYPDPAWNQLTWTAVQLQALVRVHFRKFLLSPLSNVALQNGRTALDAIVRHLALQDGNVPLAVIVRATRFVLEMGGDDVRLQGSGWVNRLIGVPP